MSTLPATPDSLATGGSALAWGLTAGPLVSDPVPEAPRGGHVRRWLYVAAAGEDAAIGAAVVDALPRWVPVVVAFAWARIGDEVVTWERRLPRRSRTFVGARPADGASASVAGHPKQEVRLTPSGGLVVDLALADGRPLSARVEAEAAIPAVLATRTPGGGWNVTQKLAGAPATGAITLGEVTVPLHGGAWTDWSCGRQDRDTTWRWAAGVGTSPDGTPVGINVSTGMNGIGDREDLVWWAGRPQRVGLAHLAPTGPDPAGDWTVGGDGWSLAFEPVGARTANDDLWVFRSRYVQPIGCFSGTVPDPSGRPVPVRLHGVTEDHRVRW